jgi:uncharacterized membrane protein YbhN (UPF0104 family)
VNRLRAVELEAEAFEPRRPARRWTVLGRAAVSIILLAWILQRTDIVEVWRSLQAANGALLVAAFGSCLVGYMLGLGRFRMLLAVQGVRPPPGALVRSLLVAMFFNNLLPSTIGGDASRAHDSWRWGASRGRALAVVFLDRFLGIVALLIFALIASLLWHGVNGRLHVLPLWIALAAFGALGLTASLVWLPAEWIRSAVGAVRLPGGAFVLRVVGHVSEAFEAFRGRKGVLARALALSLLLQANAVLYYYMVARALGFGVPLLPFFLIVPLSIFAMMLPISINGIGLRENAFAFFFGAFGVLASQSVALAWIDYGFMLLQGVAGGIAYALRK